MPKPYHFYTVEFMDIYSGNHYFRLIDAPVEATHAERMDHFDRDINGTGANYDPQYTITAYEIDMDDDELVTLGLRPRVLYDTYYDTLLRGAA
jgi:hypothetical protein